MYQISDEYRAKMLDQVQTHRLKGTLNGNISFTDSDVIGVSYKNQCSDKKVNVGSVYVGVLKLTFLQDFLNRGSYDKKTITISDGMYLGLDENDDPVWEDIPVGTFYIADAVWTAENMISITAYDCLFLMDKTLEIDTSAGTVYSFCKYIETKTGATFGMTQEECQALPNGTEVIAAYEENSMETYRDLLSALAQFVGGFAYAAKDGTWKLRTFDNSSVVTIPKNRRMSGAKYSDFTTLYDAISYVEQSTGMLRVVGDATGVIMKLGANPFLQYGSADAIDRRTNTIVNAIKKIRYTPYSAGLLPAFVALDLGDVISFTSDYASETTSGGIMVLAWTYNKSYKVQCYGDNPALQSAQSQTEKNISGLVRSTSENQVTYYNYANVDALTFGSEVETSIARIRFSPAQKTTVKIMHEFIMDMISNLSTDGSYELHYYLDDELVAYSPYERIKGIYGASSGSTEFSICRDFFYIVRDVEPGTFHTWEVKVVTHGITSTTIDVDHAHVTLEGQRLYSEEFFGGFIEASDTITVISLGYLELVSISDSATVSLFTNSNISASDSVALYDIAYLTPLNMAEGTGDAAPQIRLRGGHFIDTEILERITTEDGARLITE
jgi:hypothetical protein